MEEDKDNNPKPPDGEKPAEDSTPIDGRINIDPPDNQGDPDAGVSDPPSGNTVLSDI